MGCSQSNERTEEFFDLILPIKNFEGAKFRSIDESVSFLMNPELMDGDNKYECSNCGSKQEAFKGQKFSHLPEVLTLSLMRFDFNYHTYERIKINDFYQFDLRLNMGKYLPEGEEYDLLAVIVHRGDAYAGHYHAIIRNPFRDPQAAHSVQSMVKEANQSQKGRSWLTEGVKNVGPESAGLLRTMLQKNQIYDKHGGKKDQKAGEAKKGKGGKDPAVPPTSGYTDFQETEDPFPTTVPRNSDTEYLFEDWWDFDDSRVTPFSVHKLQKYFGDNKESAYILVYRKTSLSKTPFVPVQPPANVLGLVQQEEIMMQTIVENYESYKQKIYMHLRHVDHTYDFGNDLIIHGQHSTIEVDLKESLRSLKQKVRQSLGLPEELRFVLVEYSVSPNSMVELSQIVTDIEGWAEEFLRVEELQISHDLHYFVLPIDHPKYSSFKDKVTAANTKVRVQIKINDDQFEIFVPKYANNSQLREILQGFADWDLTYDDIYIQDNWELKSLSEVAPVSRGAGIPKDDFEIVLRKSSEAFKNGGLVYIKGDDFAEDATRGTILVWTDEDSSPGPYKFLVKLETTLEDILKLLKIHFVMDLASQRRLRDLTSNRMVSQEDLKRTLGEIRKETFNGESNLGQRFRVERGSTSKSGILKATVHFDVFDAKDKTKLHSEMPYSLSDSVGELLERACKLFGETLDPDEYSLYTCNWANEASKKLKDSHATAEEEGLLENCSLRLMHFTQGMSDEMRTFEVFYSESGFPDDQRLLGKVSVNENQTVEEVKRAIKKLCTPAQKFEHEFETSHMLLRKLNKLNKPCKVLSEGNKTLKRLKVNCVGLVFTLFAEPVQYRPHELRLFARERIGQGYRNFEDLVVPATKPEIPLRDLKEAILRLADKTAQDWDLYLVKYNPKEYIWLRMTEDSDNITRKPYFLADGDIIGYMILPKNQGLPDKEDFQSAEDREWRQALAVAMEKQGRRFTKESNFKLNIDF